MPFNGAGTEVPFVAAAQAYVDFNIVAPKGFTPAHILVNRAADAVGFSFDLPGQANGWVQLVETKTAATPDQYQLNFALAKDQEPGFFTPTTLNHGKVKATMAAANNIGRLLWVDGGVAFDITGEAVTPGQVTALVAQMLYG